MAKLTIYQYIAANDPVGSEAVCNKYGYSVQDVNSADDMAICLEQLVGNEGMPALKDIANLHPDKDLILETFGSGNPGFDNQPIAAQTNGNGGCSCGASGKVAQQYVSDAQGGNGFSLAGVNQGGLFVIGAIVILGLVIISSNKS